MGLRKDCRRRRQVGTAWPASAVLGGALLFGYDTGTGHRAADSAVLLTNSDGFRR
jgi:hypothetical protein